MCALAHLHTLRLLISSSTVPSNHCITMRRDLPPRHRVSHCNLHAPRGRIILFSKGCPSPLFAPLCTVVAAAPTQAAWLVASGPLAAAPLQARHGQPPHVAWSLAIAPCSLAASGSPLPAGHSWSCPRVAAAPVGGHPVTGLAEFA
ncbi:hypothetical protein BHM03_00051438 [Ensete ventricosum]|nr:hypothetical protein BHM03_00051438 [Ensete ventricosum]